MTFDEWYTTQRHWLTNEQVCQKIWDAATKEEREARRKMNENKPDAVTPLRFNDGLEGETVWSIHYYDGRAMQVTRFRAHCKSCAWRRFESQNRGCRVSVVVPANAKSQATDAALSRQVACTDGLGRKR